MTKLSIFLQNVNVYIPPMPERCHTYSQSFVMIYYAGAFQHTLTICEMAKDAGIS
jgi:hypothetical protein